MATIPARDVQDTGRLHVLYMEGRRKEGLVMEMRYIFAIVDGAGDDTGLRVASEPFDLDLTTLPAGAGAAFMPQALLDECTAKINGGQVIQGG